MYAWVWRKLPGPAALRALEMLVGAAVIVLLLFTVVFPAVQRWLPFNDANFQGNKPTPTATSTTQPTAVPTASSLPGDG